MDGGVEENENVMWRKDEGSFYFIIDEDGTDRIEFVFSENNNVITFTETDTYEGETDVYITKFTRE